MGHGGPFVTFSPTCKREHHWLFSSSLGGTERGIMLPKKQFWGKTQFKVQLDLYLVLSPVVSASLWSLVMLNTPCLGSSLGLWAWSIHGTPDCVVWDHSLLSQLATAEKLEHTDKTKWCLQRNVNVCIRHLQKQADGFPTAPAPVNTWSRQPLGISCIIPLLSQAGSRALSTCLFPQMRENGREGLVANLTHTPEFQTNPCGSDLSFHWGLGNWTTGALLRNHKYFTAVEQLVYVQLVGLGRASDQPQEPRGMAEN